MAVYMHILDHADVEEYARCCGGDEEMTVALIVLAAIVFLLLIAALRMNGDDM